jgi:5'-methylthioadenosine phosphorylase
VEIDTPFGKPSSKIVIGKIHDEPVAFLSRHDVNHRLTPSEVPYQANIYALKSLGVKYLLCFSACGSLQEHIKPTDLVVPDQFIDRTKHRSDTFFGNGVVAHISFGDPVCPLMKNVVVEAIKNCKLENVSLHSGGTYICMEGPAFSTRAESMMHRMLGGSIIGMTAAQEAKLAMEAEMAYTTVGLVTDYDCWHNDHGNVTVDMVDKALKQNNRNAQLILKEVVRLLKTNKFKSPSHDALKFALMTKPESFSLENKKRLKEIVKKYVDCNE